MRNRVISYIAVFVRKAKWQDYRNEITLTAHIRLQLQFTKCTMYGTRYGISDHSIHSIPFLSFGFIYLCLNCTDFAINLNGIKGIRFESTWKPRHWEWKQQTSDFELHVTKHFTACSSHRFMNKRKQIYLSTGSVSKCVSMQR